MEFFSINKITFEKSNAFMFVEYLKLHEKKKFFFRLKSKPEIENWCWKTSRDDFV